MSGAIYEITCDACMDPVDPNQTQKTSRDPGGQARYNYIGMTRTSVHCRMASHLQGQRSRAAANPLYRHGVDHHNGDPQSYTTRIIARERNLLPLNIVEGLHIERQINGTSMNERQEYGRGGIVRLTAERGIS